MTGTPAPSPLLQTFTQSGAPNAFGTLATYAAGTTTPQATYTDSTLVTPNQNPTTFNAIGQAAVYLTPGLSYKFICFDQFGNQLWSADNIAGGISLTGSVIPVSDNIFNIGSPSFRWANGYFGTAVYVNGVPVPTYGINAAEIAAGVTPSVLTWPWGDIRRYGALLTSPDNSVAIQAAINQAQQPNGAAVRVPMGTWPYLTGLVINSGGVSIIGDNQLQSVLQKGGNIVGLNITANAYLSNIAFDSAQTGGDTSDGIVVNTTGHVSMSQVRVLHHGGHGIDVLQANIHSYNDVTSAFNTGDGMHLAGSGSIQANAASFFNINCASNTGWGMNFLTAMSNMGMGIDCHDNVAGGIQLGACFGNALCGVYLESNTGPDLSFTSACVSPNFGGNLVIVTFSNDNPSFAGTSAAVNTVYTMKPGATHQPMFSNLLADQLVFSNQRTDGTTPTGTFTVSHANNNELDVTANSSANSITKFLNAGAGSHQIQASVLVATGAQTGLGAGTVVYGGTVATTVGAAGGASALPATPLGYILINVANTVAKIPYYNQ